ncbi:glycosyltransferase family 39 protein, partial [Oscillochloris sp. ZM17-4]|uniref:glycosyltransferase family 39 protein n=1 Tax=Oscillochloris sp. ZM17-4 TaxID=2866714 RepID=UPI001C72CD2D
MVNDDLIQPKHSTFSIQHLALWFALLLGLGLRLALWGNLPRLGMIGDEAEYLAAADWLAQGRGFAWHLGYLWTRAPLYPLFLAAHLALFGHSLTPIFVSQTILSLLSVALVYLLARQVVGGWELGVGGRGQMARAPGIAAMMAAVYLPFASYGQLLLGETLFTALLLGGLAALGAWARRGGWAWLAGAGALLGLATLTRG